MTDKDISTHVCYDNVDEIKQFDWFYYFNSYNDMQN